MSTRPTTDRIKETLFNMLNPYLADCSFLDLFSGSGAIGIEALSRGAKKAYFVDSDKDCIHVIIENLKFTKFSDVAVVLHCDAYSSLRKIEEKEKNPFSVIFMDPPYGEGLEENVLLYLASSSLVDADTLIILEESIHADLSFLESLPFTVLRYKKYKSNQHLWLKRKP